MVEKVQKRLITQTQVSLGVGEVEQLLAKHFRINVRLCDVEWRICQNCVHGVTITTTKEETVE